MIEKNKAPFDEQWEEILSNFDWGKVQEVMVFLNWKWSGCKGVPERSEIIKTAKRLCKDAHELNGHGSFGTGGFKATNFCGIIGLHFEIEGWESFNA